GVSYDREVGPLLGLAFKKRLICAGSFSLFCGGLEQRRHGSAAPITSIVVTSFEACGLSGLHKGLRGGDDGRTDGNSQMGMAAVGSRADCDLGGGRQPLALPKVG